MIDYTAAGFTLLQGAHLYAPEDRGICDVLVANGKIIAVASNIPSDIVPNCTVVDLSGQILCPGSVSYTHLDVYKRQNMCWQACILPSLHKRCGKVPEHFLPLYCLLWRCSSRRINTLSPQRHWQKSRNNP